MFPTPDTHLYDKCGASPVTVNKQTFGLKDLNPTMLELTDEDVIGFFLYIYIYVF